MWSLMCRLHALTRLHLNDDLVSVLSNAVQHILTASKRLFEKDRTACFIVMEQLMDLRQQWWQSNATGTDVILLMQLNCVEIRLMIDTLGRVMIDTKVNRHPPTSNTTKPSQEATSTATAAATAATTTPEAKDTNKEDTNQAQDHPNHEQQQQDMADQATLQRTLQVLPICFQLLEKAVHGLCSDDTEHTGDQVTSVWLSMSSVHLLKLRDCLVGAVKDIIAFIKYVASEPPAFYAQCLDPQDGLHALAVARMTSLHDVLGACLRTVSLWLIVDVDSIEIEMTEIIRHVLCNPSKPGFHSNSIEYFIGPGLVQLLHSESVRMELYDCNGHVTLLEQLTKYVHELAGLGGEDGGADEETLETLEHLVVVEQKIDSLVAAMVSVLQTCTVLIVQYGSTDAYVFDGVGVFVPAFRTLLNGGLMNQVVVQQIEPRTVVSENAKYCVELLKGLSWKQRKS